MTITEFLSISEERQYNVLRKICNKFHYVFNEVGDYDINVIMIRNATTVHNIGFNDYICIAYKINEIKYVECYKATADQNRTYSFRLFNKDINKVILPQQVINGFEYDTMLGVTTIAQNAPFDIISNTQPHAEIAMLSLLRYEEINRIYNTKEIGSNEIIIYDRNYERIGRIETIHDNFIMTTRPLFGIKGILGLYKQGNIVFKSINDYYRFIDTIKQYTLNHSRFFNATFIISEDLKPYKL
jgi:hypothetical protein